MKYVVRTVVGIVAVCGALGFLALRAEAIAVVTSNDFTCESFTASGTTTAPFVVVEVYNPDGDGEDLIFESFPANEDGTFSIAVVWPELPEGTVLERWVWGSPTDDPDDWDGEDYFFDEGACVAQVDPTTTTESTTTTTTPPPEPTSTEPPAVAPAAATRPQFTG
jgi:hypothetical protein